MPLSRMLAVLAAVVVVLSITLAQGVGPAHAAPGFDAEIEVSTFTATGIADGTNFGSGSSVCTPGDHLTGGGVGTTGPTPVGAVSVRYLTEESTPLDPTGLVANTDDGDVVRTWFGFMQNQSGATQTFKVMGICSPSSDAIIEAQPLTLAAGFEGPATAMCPGTMRAVGGGVGNTGPKNDANLYSVEASNPVDSTGLTANTNTGDIAKGWFAYVLNNTTTSKDYKVFALCSQNSDATIEATSVSIPSYEGRIMTVPCPTGKRALGGGVGTTAPTPLYDANWSEYVTQLSNPLDETGLVANTNTGDAARSWFGYGFNENFAFTAETFKTFAICAYDNYPRPKGATPLRVSLVPTYKACSAANRTHGPPLAFNACNPPALESAQLTIGTPDANGKTANSSGFARYSTIVGAPGGADDSDVSFQFQLTDVRRQGTLVDYTGEVQATTTLRLIDRANNTTGDAGTLGDLQLSVGMPCTATGGTADIGATCSLTTTFDALTAGLVPEGQRSIWQLGQVRVNDGGSDGDVDTTPNTPFAVQGIFVP